jgi:glycosyltransferase involved in cell wall biosynthesis
MSRKHVASSSALGTAVTGALSIGLVCEQLLAPIPGGIGTYVRGLLRALPQNGVGVIPHVAWHRKDDVAQAGLEGARRLPLPRRALYEGWSRFGRPTFGLEGDVVHAPSLAFPSPLRRPLVVTVHDVLFLEFPETFPAHGLAFHRRALSRVADADLVICPSRATAAALESIEAPPERVRVVPLGADVVPPEDPARVLDAVGIDRPYVLWVGTMEPRKNLRRAIGGFLRAAESHAPEAGHLKLYLAGPTGWLSGPVSELLTRSDVRDRVRPLGVLPTETLAAAYAGAETFLFPSLGEGFGLPVLEAMAAGAPVVTSDRSSLPEVAGDAAVLCDPTDEDSIASALVSILADPSLAQRLRERGRARAAEFTWERTARETAACYREVAGETA